MQDGTTVPARLPIGELPGNHVVTRTHSGEGFLAALPWAKYQSTVCPDLTQTTGVVPDTDISVLSIGSRTWPQLLPQITTFQENRVMFSSR